jgi:serine/threonine-protein kinase HipA
VSDEAYKFVEVAAVLKAGRRVAHLMREPTGVVFAYEPNYDGPAVATTLPVGGAPVRHAGGALPPFFAGLLPEGRRLTAIRQAVKTSADDELSLLLVVGGDLVGDVSVLPDGDSSPFPATEVAGSLDDIVFRELFERAVGPSIADRAGLAGVQDKVSGRMIALPVAYDDAAWILKLDPPEYPGLVANEAFFLAAARRSGLRTADASIVRDKEGHAGLLVRRFDRFAVAGELRRLAQEDACQVLGRYPADKYRMTTEEVIAGLAARTGAPVVAARSLLQQFAFAYLTCNGDAHGKNFSVLHNGTEWQVAPAYDLPSTQPYRDDTMALAIGGKQREDIGRAEFVALGNGCGVPEKAVARVLDELIAAAPVWLGDLDALPFDERRIHKLRKACSYRLARLRG